MNRNLEYYINTIGLKLSGQFYSQLQKVREEEGFGSLKKRIEKFDTSNKPTINPSKYLTYSFLESPETQRRIMHQNNRGIYTSANHGSYVGYDVPIYPAHYALLCSEKVYNSKLGKWAKDLELSISYLKEKIHEVEGCFTLPYDFDFEDYGLKNPYYNGLAQSLAASAFVRYASIFNQPQHIETAEKLLDAMFLPVEKGGVFTTTKMNNPWIEEYPSPGGSYVLNGFIGSLIGLLDFEAFTGNNKFHERAFDLIDSLKSELPSFIYGDNIRYCKRHFRLSNLNYQGLYVFQFLHIYSLTSDPYFINTSRAINNLNWSSFGKLYGMNKTDHIDEILQHYQIA